MKNHYISIRRANVNTTWQNQALARTENSRTHKLLVEIQDGRANLENVWQFLIKLKKTTTLKKSFSFRYTYQNIRWMKLCDVWDLCQNYQGQDTRLNKEPKLIYLTNSNLTPGYLLKRKYINMSTYKDMYANVYNTFFIKSLKLETAQMFVN